VFISVFAVFFFQAEDGIRDRDVTGVQTCALPIWPSNQLLYRASGCGCCQPLIPMSYQASLAINTYTHMRDDDCLNPHCTRKNEKKFRNDVEQKLRILLYRIYTY